MRLCRLMCGRPLAFRGMRLKNLGLRPVFGAQPNPLCALTEARSASAHQTAEPQHRDPGKLGQRVLISGKATHVAILAERVETHCLGSNKSTLSASAKRTE